MAENYDLIFGQSASKQYAWSDSDYQNGWQTVGSTPPTAEQFDALQRRADLKAQELNNRLAPIEGNDTHDYRQPSTAYAVGSIAYHASLPTGYYLECMGTGGITSAGDLVITSPNVGNTVKDGTVVWTIRKIADTTEATTTTKGLMSAADKKKLNGVASNANNYSLPAATGSTRGGVTVGSNISLSGDKISLTSSNVTNALGYTPPSTTGANASGSWNINAATSNKLATARTIALSGDATGSATFDGSGNATIAVTLVRGAVLGYRQPSKAYTVGQIAYHASLPTGWYLECTTKGTTSSGDITPTSTIGGTVTDGTVAWKVCKDIGTGNAPIYAGYNQRQTFTSSGSFTAPITGIYKITLQGGGGGGAAGMKDDSTYGYGNRGGGGGGAGAKIEFYEKLTSGASYGFIVGGGGSVVVNGAGNRGGNSTITINTNYYVAGGGYGGRYVGDAFIGGNGGQGKINDTIVSYGMSGSGGGTASNSGTTTALGGNGGNSAFNTAPNKDAPNEVFGAGGDGGGYHAGLNNPGAYAGGAGGNGYITFEWLDPTL